MHVVCTMQSESSIWCMDAAERFADIMHTTRPKMMRNNLLFPSDIHFDLELNQLNHIIAPISSQKTIKKKINDTYVLLILLF